MKGVHRVKKKLADGTIKYYYFAWRGGPRMKSKPGTDEFLTEFTTLKRQHAKPALGTIDALIDEYKNSSWYTRKQFETKRGYDRSLNLISEQFGTMKLIALKANGVRRHFLKWHEAMSDKPRAADLHMTMLRRLLSYGTHIEVIQRNPLEQTFERLSHGSRKDIVWSTEQQDNARLNAHKHIRDAILMALWTMQRQGDLLKMATFSVDGDRIPIIQGKTGSRVWVTIPDEIRPIIDEAKAAGRQRILVNSRGENWTSSGFQSSCGKELKRLGITGVTFNDLRGTGITYCYAMGMDIKDIALISGHSEDSVNTVIRKHYLAGEAVVAAIRKGRT